jgi:putative ABC transport system ATP-binding protein
MATAVESVFEARGLTKTYDMGEVQVRALQGVDLDLYPGELVVLTRASDRELTEYRRNYVGFVFQFYNLIPSLTAKENVAAVTEIAENPMKPEEALKLVGLGDRMDHFPSQMSGGQQQRVAIARAIAKNPAVLLCDEPTGALDSTTGVVVLEALERANRELGATTVIITHNADIARMADRVVHLRDGQIVSEERNDVKTAAKDIVW